MASKLSPLESFILTTSSPQEVSEYASRVLKSEFPLSGSRSVPIGALSDSPYPRAMMDSLLTADAHSVHQ
jgi:hypothetical protein